jgi:hypothetical protein
VADSLRSGRSRLAATTTRTTKLVRSVTRTDPKIAATPVGTGGSGPLLPLPPSRPPARGPAVFHPETSESEPLVRFLGVAAFLTVPVALTLLGADGATHDAARFLAGYSPERLVHGAVWTLPLSALLLPNVRMVGPTTVFTIAFLLPYALLRGPLRALVVFFSGHVVATLCVAVVAVGAHVAAWSTVAPLYRHLDFGASAGLAAVIGGLIGVVSSRSRPAGAFALVFVTGYFVVALLRSPGVIHGAAQAEQLIALGVGLAVERHWHHAVSRVGPAT